jgi:hypothetical protein
LPPNRTSNGTQQEMEPSNMTGTDAKNNDDAELRPDEPPWGLRWLRIRRRVRG